jgi:nucleoside-diphosphate-sugar epimerase
MINFSKLDNSKIGILGLGYIGQNLNLFLANLRKYDIDIILINEKNLNCIETQTFDYFINCAGNSGDFRGNILNTINSNVGLLSYLLKHMKIRKSYLGLSSTRVYGFTSDKKVAFCENDFSKQNHFEIDYIYDGSKKMIESMLFNYSEKVNYEIKIVRLSNVYGRFNKLDDSTLIKKIIKSKIDDNILSVNVNKNSSKDYIYIDDALIGILKVLIYPSKFEVFNIGSGFSYSLNEISEMMNFKIGFADNCLNETHCGISIRKAKKELEFSIQNNFQNCLENIINKKEKIWNQ